MSYKTLRILAILALLSAACSQMLIGTAQAAPLQAPANTTPENEKDTPDSMPDKEMEDKETPADTAPIKPAPTGNESMQVTPEPQKSTPKPKEDVALGSYLSGRFAETQGDTGNGIRFLRESLKRDPDNKETLSSLYRMLILSGHIDEAIGIAHKLEGTPVVDEGSEFSPEMLRVVEEGKQGQFDAALKRLHAIPKAGFNNLLVPLMEAWLKLGAGTLKSPVEAKEMMPEAHVILPHVYLNAAMINDIAGFDKSAREQYEAAVKDERIEPFRAVEALVNYYDRKGETEKRQKLVKDYITAHGDSFLADELLATSKTDHPKPLVANATEGLAEVFYTMANIFHGVRAPADEIATLHIALYLRPDFAPAQFLLADADEGAQDYRSAIAAYQGIDKDSPYYARGKIRSVYDESEIEDPAIVITKLDALAAENPHDVDALLAKGDILRLQKHMKEAIEAYTAALTRVTTPQKHHWIIYFSRGDCYEQMGQWGKAEADMKKALELSPGEPDVLNYLGYSWLSQHRNMAEARKMIEDAYEARPEDAHIIDSMGYALYMNGEFSNAQEYFEQALERTPNDPTVNDHLGDTYWQLGRKTEARFQWERALGDDPDEETARDLHKKLDKGLAMIPPAQASQEKKPSEPTEE